MARSDGQVVVQLSADGTQLSSGLQQAGDAIRRFGRTVSGQAGAFAGLDAAAVATGARLVKIAEGLAVVGQKMQEFSRGIAQGFGAAIGVGAEFEKQMRNVNSIAKEGEAKFQATSAAVLQMSSKLGLTDGPTKMAAALYDINSSGFKGAAGMKVLEASTKAAAAGLTETGVSSKVIVGSLNAYGKGAEYADRFSNVLFKTVDAGTISFEELAQNLGQVTATAANFGVSFEELNAGIAVLTNRGIKAPEAVTALNSAISHLAAPTKEAQDEMARYGLHVDATTLRAKGLRATLLEIWTKTGGNADAVKKILGEDTAMKAGLVLMQDKGKALGEATAGNLNSGGALDAALAEQRKSLAFQWAAFQKQIEVAGISIANGLMPYAKQVVRFAKQVVDAFNSLPSGTRTLIGTVTAAAGAFAGLAGTLLVFAPAIASVITLVTAGPIAAAIAGIGSAIGAIALPVGIAVAAVAALYVAWQNDWGGIQEFTRSTASTVWTYLVDGFNYLRVELPKLWNEAWTQIRFAFSRFWTEVKPVVQEGVSFLGEAWESIVPIVKMWWALYLPALQAQFALLWEAVKFTMASISAYWSVSWEVIKGVVSTVWPLVKGVVLSGFDLIKGIFEAFGKAINGDWKGAWDSIVTALDKVGGRVQSAVKDMLANALQAIKNVAGQWALAGENLVKSFAQGIANSGGALKTAIQNMVTGSKDAGPDMVDRPLQPLTTGGLLPPPPYPIRAGAEAKFTPRPQPIVAAKPDFGKVTPTALASKKTAPKTMLDALLAAAQGGDMNARLLGPGGNFSDSRSAGTYRSRPGQHNGYDITMRPGSVVGAAFKGTVRAIYPMGPPGEYGVVVDSGTFTTAYNHIRSGVTVGANVNAGDPIGKTVIDHLDVKLKDAAGKYFDPRKTLDKSGTRGAALQLELGQAALNFSRLRPMGTSKEFQQERDKVEADYRGASLNYAPGSKEAEEQLAQRQRLLDRINLMETRSEEDKQLKFDRMRAQAQEVQLAGAGDLEVKKLAIAEKYRQEYRAIEDEEALHPDKTVELERTRGQLRIAEAQEQAQVMIGIVDKLNAARYTATVEEQKLSDQRFAERTRQIEEERKMGRITSEEAMAQYGLELNTYQSGSQARMDAELTYQEKFKEGLTQKQQILGDDFLQYLEKLNAQLLLVDQTLLTNQLQMQAVQQALQAQRQAKLQEEKAKIQQVATGINQSFQSFLEQVATGQQSFNTAFASLWKSIVQIVIQYITQMIVKTLALQAIMKGVFGFLTGGAGLFTGGVGTSFTSFIPIAHSGGLVVPGGIQTLHAGGFAGLSTRPDEILAKLQVGEMVLSRDQVEEARRGGSSRSEQPGIYAPLTLEAVYIREEADIDRLATAIAQRQREEWQAW